MITVIIFSVFVLLLLKKYEYTFTLIIIISVLLRHFPLLNDNIYTFISGFAILLFPFKMGKVKEIQSRFPFLLSCLCLIISLILSNYFATTKHYFSVIRDCIPCLSLFCFWKILNKDPKSITQYSLKCILIFGGLISFYALFETITKTNPYINFVNNLNLYSNDYLVTEIRYGFKRSQSIFSMHTTNGGISLILFTILLYAKQHSIICFSRLKTLIIYLLVVTIFLTGSRAAIIGCIISLFMFTSKVTLRGNKLFMILFCFLLLSPLLYNYLNTIYLSLIDTQNVAGSNTDMRTTQFELALFFLNKNFWFGNGLAYTWEHVLYYYEELLGAESLWIPIMIDQGIIGVISHIILIINCIVYAYKNKQTPLLFFILGFFTFNTLSSIPSVSILYVPFSLMIMITMYNISTEK